MAAWEAMVRLTELALTCRPDRASPFRVVRSLANEEIAHLLGYSDRKSFFGSYRRWTGMSPSEARRTAGEVGQK
ncbi:AraC family transcriptional regulator [Allopontixanthobacter sediminis]|uniref:HTH araC/xylS-type domain-containing protein n=1 Tax=Allopontixanthobacter sediminis TaxID=1689985 RepID=A0A845B5S2_9SPHN|nr:AraC family transcriptional regulator [Allopontixanthobacter sediminis]MXP45710.1 hypothetical protein [Allopontixanthobacter sediminis]